MKKKSKLQWITAQLPEENARRILPRLARQYFSLGKKIVRADASEPALHQFRLATKRFRYTLEMFVPVYGPGLQQRLNQVRQVQQVLGEVQDCQTVRSMDAAKHHVVLMEWLERRLDRKKAEFQRLWIELFSTDESQLRWVQYLERYARARKSS